MYRERGRVPFLIGSKIDTDGGRPMFVILHMCTRMYMREVHFTYTYIRDYDRPATLTQEGFVLFSSFPSDYSPREADIRG